MLETIIVVVLLLWLVGAFGWRGRVRWRRGARGGSLIHILLIIVLILLLIRYL